MRYYLLVSHGKYAQGASDSLKLFLGEQHKFMTINAYVDQHDPKMEISSFFSSVKENDEVIICTDLLGGSVNQIVIPYLSRKHTYLIAGFNLSLLLELSFLREPLQIEELRCLIEKAKDSITLMNDYVMDTYRVEDE